MFSTEVANYNLVKTPIALDCISDRDTRKGPTVGGGGGPDKLLQTMSMFTEDTNCNMQR